MYWHRRLRVPASQQSQNLRPNAAPHLQSGFFVARSYQRLRRVRTQERRQIPTQRDRHLPATLSGEDKDPRDAAERRAIAAAMVATRGDVTRAAEWLQVSRSTLFEKLRRLGLRGDGG